MRIHHSFVVASMAVLFVFDSTTTNTVSASSGIDGFRISTILRRSLNARSHNSDSESTNDEPTEARPVQKSGVPQLGLSPAMMQRISAGLVTTIAKFSADKEAGVDFPTQQEMTQAVDQALWTSDYTNFVKVSQAIKISIDALADRKLAEGQTGKSRATKVPNLASSSVQSSAEQIATALLETIEMFCEQKASGGRLPTATEVNQALTPALQKIDFRDVKKGAEALKVGLDHMGPTKLPVAEELPRTRELINTDSVNSNEDSNQVGPSRTRFGSPSGVPQLGLSPEMMQRISTGLVSTIAKFLADQQAGVEFPTRQEMSQAVDKALWTSDYTNFIKVAQAIKMSIDALADRKLAEGKTGTSRASKVSDVTSSSVSSSADRIAAALLETIHLFCSDRAAGGQLPTPAEVNKALTPALQKIDFSDVRRGAEALKLGLDHMAPIKGSAVLGSSLSGQNHEAEVQA
ncbi:secreted protein [Melampsora americana]|nr:secreted protein [Melampsora americana]